MLFVCRLLMAHHTTPLLSVGSILTAVVGATGSEASNITTKLLAGRDMQQMTCVPIHTTGDLLALFRLSHKAACVPSVHDVCICVAGVQQWFFVTQQTVTSAGETGSVAAAVAARRLLHAWPCSDYKVACIMHHTPWMVVVVRNNILKSEVHVS